MVINIITDCTWLEDSDIKCFVPHVALCDCIQSFLIKNDLKQLKYGVTTGPGVMYLYINDFIGHIVEIFY